VQRPFQGPAPSYPYGHNIKRNTGHKAPRLLSVCLLLSSTYFQYTHYPRQNTITYYRPRISTELSSNRIILYSGILHSLNIINITSIIHQRSSHILYKDIRCQSLILFVLSKDECNICIL